MSNEEITAQLEQTEGWLDLCRADKDSLLVQWRAEQHLRLHYEDAIRSALKRIENGLDHAVGGPTVREILEKALTP